VGWGFLHITLPIGTPRRLVVVDIMLTHTMISFIMLTRTNVSNHTMNPFVFVATISSFNFFLSIRRLHFLDMKAVAFGFGAPLEKNGDASLKTL
jgi:NO-binding membrane sensor protein with MHYT domain